MSTVARPVTASEPMPTPVAVVEPVPPVTVVEPIAVPVTVVEPVPTPVTVVEPIAVPVTVVEPIAVPVTVVEPIAVPVVAVPVMVAAPVAAPVPVVVPTPVPAVVFTPQMDERILRGLVEDEVGLLREMSEHGYPAAAVRTRATRLGLTEQVVMRCRLAGTWPSMRECLGCEQRFLSTGTHHRLCKRCRPQR